MEEVIKEAELEEERSDGHLLKEQVASAKQALSGNRPAAQGRPGLPARA